MTHSENENYDQASGPKLWIKREGGGASDQAKVRRGPRDLERSRRVGITKVACASCGADCNTVPITHAKLCGAIHSDGFQRTKTTRPLRYAR